MTNFTGRHGWRAVRPWRSAVGGWIVAALTLIGAIPLFLCMPPWNDVTLHDMAVRSMFRGGTHYRDVFDTNLPGIDWIMYGVRAAFGWSYEVLRAVDLAIIGGAVALLTYFVRRSSGTTYSVAWFIAAAAMFYPFTSEFNHIQRDSWLLLPVVYAVYLRMRQVERASCANPLFRNGLIEGLVWGVAVWIKPHAICMAFVVWLTSAVLLARCQSRKRIAVDLAGLLTGGLVLGMTGVAWLFATGAWQYFLDIFLNWNTDYISEMPPLGSRVATAFTCFPPWSYLHYAAIPIAFASIWAARTRQPSEAASADNTAMQRLYLPPETQAIANSRVLLSIMYLAWFGQAVLIQKPFEYVHLPITLLAMAIVASQRWCIGFLALCWFILAALLSLLITPPALIAQHPLTKPSMLRLWPRCFSEGSSPEMRDELGHFTNTAWGTNWRELHDVAAFLRTVDPEIGPGELNCWHDTTHPLYLMLDLDPATRYMHYGTAYGIKSKRDVIAEEVRASRQRYVVSDLMRTTWRPHQVYSILSWRDNDPLPTWLPPRERERFPWNQPVIYRSGRYVVHRIDHSRPLGVIRIPDWDKLDSLDNE